MSLLFYSAYFLTLFGSFLCGIYFTIKISAPVSRRCIRLAWKKVEEDMDKIREQYQEDEAARRIREYWVKELDLKFLKDLDKEK